MRRAKGEDDEMDDSRHFYEVQRELSHTVRLLGQSVQDLSVAVSTLRAEMPTRGDIQREIEKRLPVETYAVAHAALENEVRERAKGLEREIADHHKDFLDLEKRIQSSWQRAAPWVAIGVAMLFGFFDSLVAIAGTIVAIIALTHH